MSEKVEDRQVFELKTDTVLTNCIASLHRLVPDPDKPFQVIISSGMDLRSLAQNRLYWKHMGEIELATGENRQDAAVRLKRKFLHPIFMEGETKANELYQINFNALMTVKEAGVVIDFAKLLNQLLSTTDATVKQMRQYIDMYWPYMNGKGVHLTDPNRYMAGEIR